MPIDDVLKYIVLPVLSAIVGGAVTLGVGTFMARRGEHYRRLARWENLSEKLWEQRVDTCVAILEHYGKEMEFAVTEMFTPTGTSEEKAERIRQLGREQNKVFSRMNALCSQNVIDAAFALRSSLQLTTGLAMSEGGKPQQSGRFYNESSLNLQRLFDAIRAELHTDPLDQTLMQGIIQQMTGVNSEKPEENNPQRADG